MVLEDLKKAREIIWNIRNNLNYKFKNFERIYPFSNENINDCFSHFDLDNKKCLTVLGSSDQVLDLCLKGSNIITSFDINPLTIYYFELKKAALLSNITLEEYLKFFCFKDYSPCNTNNFSVFNQDTFNKLIPFLSSDAYLFWSSLFKEFKILEIRRVKSIFEYWDEPNKDILKETIGYLKDNNFYVLKERIKDLKFNFINCDIRNLQGNLNMEYDFIYLSNIIQYIEVMFKDKINKKRLDSLNDKEIIKLLKQYKKLIEELSINLNDDGLIIVGYLYTLLKDSKDSIIYNKSLRDKVFCDSNYSYEYFKSMVSYESDCKLEDGVLVYKK